MSPHPVWPSGASEVVLWVQLVSVWIIATYGVVQERARRPASPATTPSAPGERLAVFAATLLAASAAFLLPPVGTSLSARLILLALLAALVAGTALARGRQHPSGRAGHRGRAELEVAASALALVTTGACIGLSRIGASPADPIVRGGKAAAVLCVLAGVTFVFRGGTYIVRAVLDRSRALPRLTPRPPESPAPDDPAEPDIDVAELNRGRSIGNLERLLMVMVIVLGNYEALAFLVAAKGLIRAREFEDRDFAEYFILGSLTSAAVAMVTGLVLRITVPYLWSV